MPSRPRAGRGGGRGTPGSRPASTAGGASSRSSCTALASAAWLEEAHEAQVVVEAIRAGRRRGEALEHPGERRGGRVEGDGLAVHGERAAGVLAHGVRGDGEALRADHLEAAAREVLRVVVGDVQRGEHALPGRGDEDGAVLDGVVVDAVLDERLDRLELV